MNRPLYNQYISYFEECARNLLAIGHNPEEGRVAFVEANLLEDFENEVTNAAEVLLVLQRPTYKLINNNGENVLKEWSGGFAVVFECEENDHEAIRTAKNQGSLLVEKILTKMRKDRKMHRLFDVTFDGEEGMGISRVFRNRHGWFQTIKFKSQFSTVWNPAEWSEDEVMGPAPPPFATVQDGNTLLTLLAGQSHTCSVPQPGTVTVSNSDDSYEETVTAVHGQNTPHNLPDVDHTDSDGSTVTLPGMTPMVCTPPPPPAPATVEVNGNQFSVASGGLGLVDVVDKDGNKIGGHTGDYEPFIHQVGNVSLEINGVAALSILPEETFNLKVRLNGTPSGTFDGVDTVNVTSSAPSLAVATSNATPNLGAIVTLTATPTNLVPTGYTWYANGNQIGTGSSLAWTVNIAGAISIRCVATDGTLTAQGTVSITSLIVAQSVCHLDGVNDGFSFTAMPDDDDLGALTFRFRFLSEATGSSWPLSIVSNQAMGELLRLNITTSQAITYVWTGTGFLIGTANYLVGQWNELTFSRKTNSTVGSENVTRIWLNGSLVTSAINTGSPAAAFLAFFGQTIYGNTRMKVKALTLFQGITDNAGAAALAAQADADMPAASGLTLVEHVPFTQAPFVPSTVQPLSRANGITGRGFCQFNTSFASPFGLVAP